ncbi:MAG: serine/threonine-protein kinase [Gammaproteobacteria bacterium]
MRDTPLVGADEKQEAGEVTRLLNALANADLCAEILVRARPAGRTGERIGAYRVAEMIGAGGMGDVYKAVRDDDQYRAEVAIKVMRADVRNPLAEQRFRTERQILAALDHRNIARLLDGGTTASGLPYVVMELVAGEPIDRYCEARKLGVPERVRLFLQVCAAVAYAHQRLVVHRDLKPNNILVTADGSVKLLDFGIAKLLENDSLTVASTDHTVTHTQLRAMTLDYASPEQVSGGTVTTVSDVYSLGVVLYRLLTGESPYGARLNEAQRIAEILSETVPRRPSLVQSRRRGQRSDIDVDLDNVLLMALRKEPQKRYGTVDEFAADLRNALAGLPVLARRGTLGYRLGKYARRHKIEIAAGAAVLVALVGGLCFAIREARIAEQQRQVAQRHFDSVRKLANRLFDFHDEIAQLPNATRAREMLVKTSLEYLDALSKEAGADRALREELGVAYRRVGDIQGSPYGGNTGDTKGALESYAKSIVLLEGLYTTAPAEHRLGAVLARAYIQRTLTLVYTQGAKPAEASAQKTLALAEAMQDGVADEFERTKLLADAYWLEGAVAGSLGRPADGMKAVDRMVAVVEAYARAHPGDSRAYRALSSAYGNASILEDPRMSMADMLTRGVALSRKGLAVDEKLIALHPGEARYAWSAAESRYNLGDKLSGQGAFGEAVEQFQLAAPVLAARATDNSDMHARLISMMNESGRAWALFNVGRVAEAENAFLVAEKTLANLATQYDSLQVAFMLGQTRTRLGALYVGSAGRTELAPDAQLEYWRKARDVLAQGTASLRKISAAIPLDGTGREVFDTGLANLAKADAAIARLSAAR